nr:hypothetical protein [Methanobrevibacter arboriphilus]
MNLCKDLKQLRTLQTTAKELEDELHCKINKVVNKHSKDIPYRIDFTRDMLIIRFKTRRMPPSLCYNIDNDLGLEDGVVVPKTGFYGHQLVYNLFDEEDVING